MLFSLKLGTHLLIIVGAITSESDMFDIILTGPFYKPTVKSNVIIKAPF